ncbi:hypothetical protein ACFSKY_22420 [Azotobacter chroococcum]|uniref:DUF4376 domain-containing protein n=1 Tax=Azotobacter chroococcum TaxID=353 RepID=A0A4R1P8E7_9GAMM|nr:hypothetical protein [Azotobacter chroococcum]TBV93951.1 hypothetical protein E0E53_15825 [Azotobacter chroococcum]TCL18580.1 hypothetical protein EV691_1466 [Azotobacter chroococcum]
MIKYKADDWLRPKVEIVECERATDSSVFVNGKRRAKESANERYLDSFDEAKSWLLDRADRRLQAARNALQRAQDQLGNIKGMKEPQQ